MILQQILPLDFVNKTNLIFWKVFGSTLPLTSTKLLLFQYFDVMCAIIHNHSYCNSGDIHRDGEEGFTPFLSILRSLKILVLTGLSRLTYFLWHI